MSDQRAAKNTSKGHPWFRSRFTTAVTGCVAASCYQGQLSARSVSHDLRLKPRTGGNSAQRLGMLAVLQRNISWKENAKVEVCNQPAKYVQIWWLPRWPALFLISKAAAGLIFLCPFVALQSCQDAISHPWRLFPFKMGKKKQKTYNNDFFFNFLTGNCWDSILIVFCVC